MAKESMKARERKRVYLNNRFGGKRESLKAVVNSTESSFEERLEAQFKLQQLPKNSAKERQHNRCKLTGRPKGYMRQFGICRNQFRDMANFGLIPGVKKASW
ncbi:MAG: 30S ribosomal protein S14 [Bacteroidia bacterium]|nr:30S ribosomal protein S14 [Bacteroidia bacterium]